MYADWGYFRILFLGMRLFMAHRGEKAARLQLLAIEDHTTTSSSSSSIAAIACYVFTQVRCKALGQEYINVCTPD